jgi:stage II sporulation SpoE-like protein
MKRFLPFIAATAGVIVLLLVLPIYRPAQPKGIAVTRGDATAIADRAAREVGIPVERTFRTLVWYPSPILEKELQKHPRRAEAWDDPVLGPRLDTYRITYYYKGKDKYPPYGNVYVDGRTGRVIAARLRLRVEDPGAHPTEKELRPRADAFAFSRAFPGSPSPQFESARPNVLRGRTDWVFRYRVPLKFPLKNVVPYLTVNFVGNRLAGWDVIEEYADGRQFFGESGSEIGAMLASFAVMFGMMLILLVIFLRKYHAGEVGVSAASFLFSMLLLLGIVSSLMIRVSASEGTGMGSIDAEMTSWVTMAFKLLFADIPLAVVLFLAWAVGESYARERWGERLAAFEAILRRDPFNATVGRSLLIGALFAPAIAAAGLGIGAIPILLGRAWPNWDTSATILYLGGPFNAVVKAASQSALVTIGAVLFILAWTHRHRVFWIGLIAAAVLGIIAGTTAPPIDPLSMKLLFGFGGIAAVIAVFLGYDLLAAATSLFGATSLLLIAPLLDVSRGHMLRQVTIALAGPLVIIVAYATLAMLTRREVVYTYEDLAPHVKRIIERERVKAEIDAANRIQAALLPIDAPNLAGTSVSSHYRAATEIGGDYFDFLVQPTGEIGIAFGDVSGHGLTSGIVMAMAKAALLVQIDYDSSPRAVLDVLNDIVIRTAPKRILMTFFFGMLDPASQTLRFSSAGHLDPYVFRAATRRIEPLSSWGFPLGVRRREPFREHTVEFTAGDRLILYSDGLIEAIDDDGEPFGFVRFEETIVTNGHLSAEEIKKSLLTAVRKFTRNRPPEDDQTLVVVAFEEVLVDRPRGERPLATVLPASETVH